MVWRPAHRLGLASAFAAPRPAPAARRLPSIQIVSWSGANKGAISNDATSASISASVGRSEVDLGAPARTHTSAAIAVAIAETPLSITSSRSDA